MALATSSDEDALMYQIHHIFLPPKLPQEDDFEASHERDLLKNVLGAMEQFKAYLDDSVTFEVAISMVRAMIDCRSGSSLDVKCVSSALQHMRDGDSRALHLRSQNFGLVVSRRGDIVRFEGFELLAKNSLVMECKGRLRRTFPNTCVELDFHKFSVPAFQAVLADLLGQLDITTHASCRPKTTKAANANGEERETINPRLLALITGLLRGLGRQGECTQILKHSREEVLWCDTKDPWHRSAGWLFLRVSLQLVLDRDCETGRGLFKEFMVFLTGSMLQHGISMNLPSHLLQCMLAKVSRRCLKVLTASESSKPRWLSHTSGMMQRASSILHQTWTLIQKDDERILDLSKLQDLQFSADVSLSLCSLRPYLKSVSDPNRYTSTRATVDPSPGFAFQRADPSTLPEPSFHSQLNISLELADFEHWVAENLETWSPSHVTLSSTCQHLSRLINSYHSAASNAYDQNPVNLSIMWLTIMELWVALDTLVSSACSLLPEHKVGFPTGLLEPLTLSTITQMARLKKLEDYLLRREGQAKAHYPSAFKGFGNACSFAARFYMGSEEHQALHRNIVLLAEQDRAAKLQELKSSQLAYNSLKERYNNDSHDEYDVEGRLGPERQCRDGCSKCKLHQQMGRMRISVHEWPLPKEENEARAVVFELQVPDFISCWRQTTWKLLVDMLKDRDVPVSAIAKLYYAQEYTALVPFVSGSRDSRLQLGSIAKPFVVAHYRDLSVSEADVGKVCKNHGCRYDYYDTKHMVLQSLLVGKSAIPPNCSFAHLSNFTIPEWIRRYDHSSNEVVACQSMSPQRMALDEFKAFGHLRSGVRLQWHNILVQLNVPSVDLNNVETALLILQASYHAGPNVDDAASTYRDAHAVLAKETFGQSLLGGLRTALARVDENWECEVTVLILGRLCTRLLSCSPSGNVHQGCLDFLARVRSLSRRWVTILLEKWSTSTTEADRSDLNQRILGMALVCTSTYDVGYANFHRVFSSDEATTWFIETSIVIHDHHRPQSQAWSPLTLISLQLWQRLCYEACESVCRRIEQSRTSLDQAVKTFWPAYAPGQGSWSTVDSVTRAHVLVSASSGGLLVSFNLLDASLLVDGCPVSRLPSIYQTHATYSRLFGAQILESFPSDQAGMEFSATRKQHDWTVHFAMSGNELIIRAQRDGAIWEFVPPSRIVGDFPTTFVNSYCHWVNTNTGIVEFRPFNEPWKSGGDLWTLDSALVLQRGNLQLIDPKSETAAVLASVFEPIEESQFINIYLDTTSSTLEIQLCRYDLSFTLRAESCLIRSKNYYGMSIDHNQTIQSLVGLRSRLVLCPETSTSNDMITVIVPQGPVLSTGGRNGHPVTSTHPASSPVAAGYPVVISRRKHECFRVDTTLGRLVDSGSLQSKLFLCHLHATTSHCLPDLLTSRTGTEEALRILKSAAVASFERLGSEEVQKLTDISLMSPRRHFYPSNLRVMQNIRWSTVYDPLAQNDEFFQVAQSILCRGMNCEMFFPNERVIKELKGTEKCLAERALIRNSAYRVSGFGAENHSSQYDTDYEGRDQIKASNLEQLEHRVFQVTRNLSNGTNYLLVQPSTTLDTLYNVMSEEVDGLSSQLSTVSCRFDTGWLDPPLTSMGRKWCKIQQYLSCVDMRESKYDLIAFFGALVFAQDADLQVIQILLAFACDPTLRTLQQPQFSIFKLRHGSSVQRLALEKCLRNNKGNFSLCPESRLQSRTHETSHQVYNRRLQAYNDKVANVARDFASNLVQQWPVLVPTQPRGSDFTMYLNVQAAMSPIREYFASWFKNRQLEQHLQTVISMVEEIKVDPVPISPYVASEVQFKQSKTASGQTHIAVSDLFLQSALDMKCKAPSEFDDWCKIASGTDSGHCDSETSRNQEASPDPFQALLDSLRARASSTHHHDYVDELQTSSKSSHLEAHDVVEFLEESSRLQASLERHVRSCFSQTELFQTTLFERFRELEDQLGITFNACFPRLSPILMLEQLNRHNWGMLPTAWRQCIVQWAISLTHLQRAQRMLAAASNTNELLKEIRNVGHNWDPMQFPESLLLEVESGLMIRDVQEKIAGPMRNSLHNSCMQLNMGEGKSSVIVPIVAASLANGKQLVRILVAKPQSKQMRHMLITKLGGLLDRQVFFLPFSRSINMNFAKAEQIKRTLETCMQTGGVLLVQPEHLLSLKLMGIERLGSANKPTGLLGGDTCNHSTGTQLMRVQTFMDAYSRDIIDESDENFSVKFELIYTIGAHNPVEMSPDRWIIIQSVLSLVQQHALSVKSSHPDGIHLDLSGHKGQFATLRILTNCAAQLLLRKVARHLCNNGIHGFTTGHQSPATREAVFAYITEVSVTDEIALAIKDKGSSFFSDGTKSILLLLRGLFAGGVLAFTLGQKRWRVNYGLTSRIPPTLLAVPYRAKDSPAPRTEFSHPDIVITLTCLSYYYGGLSEDELDKCFELLQRSDQADNEFALWADSSPDLPLAFRQLGGINLKDRGQCLGQVFPALRLSKAVIDFYLHTIVFPKEMVEFPQKLSASGWDLVRPTAHLVTGFSGTCDSKYVLPLGIQQLDLPEQSHTNATVLRCLLRPENLVKTLDADFDSISLLLAVVTNNPSIDVILDVGALIIEMSNSEVARKWLELVKDAGKQAAIYVNDEDELLIVNRQGFVEPFLTSPYARNTNACLLFLDEAHTRGIDVKLPDRYRAATTLGPRLTKDRLAQACMRMRKLGKGQSVAFFIPREIQQRIKMFTNEPLTVTDVLCWAITETWHEIERSIPLWALQGLRSQRQEVIWDAKVKNNVDFAFSSNAFKDYFEDEAMSLEQRYAPNNQQISHLFAGQMKDPQLMARKTQIGLIQKQCERFEVRRFGSATLQEEQERELAPETEQERQAERPPRVEPLAHELHPDVQTMVRLGTLNTIGGGFLAAFESLKQSSAARSVDTCGFGKDLLVTADFTRTVQLAAGSCSDAFHRSVQWILTFKDQPHSCALVVLSPWEANRLLPEIEKSKHVYLHCYAARPNFSFPTLQDLRLFSTPSLPPAWTAPRHAVMQLNLFAGDLYFESWDEYKELCAYLGLSFALNDGVLKVAADGFVGRAMYPQCQFTRSPTFFLGQLLAKIRRDRQDISRTHVGRMLSGEILIEKEFLAKN